MIGMSGMFGMYRISGMIGMSGMFGMFEMYRISGMYGMSGMFGMYQLTKINYYNLKYILTRIFIYSITF